MSRWAPAIALLTALSPAHVVAAVPSTSVRVLKPHSPYRSTSPAARWTPPARPSPVAPPLGRVIPAEPLQTVAAGAVGDDPDVAALARARACKVFDRNANGVPEAGEPMVEGWRFRLTSGDRRSRVRTTGWDGCAVFEGLQPGTYLLSDLLPPLWDPDAATFTEIEVPDSREGVGATPTIVSGSCVEYARMGDADFWMGRAGLRLLDDGDRRFVNSLAPFRSPSVAFTSGAEPFDGRLADGVTRVKGTQHEAGAWGAGTWEAELTRFLEDRKVAADPRGRLAQEILLFALNMRHFLEGARVVYLEEQPIFVDDLLFEGILAWLGDSPRWNHEMTALLASINDSPSLAYVPAYQCQVAYLPF